MLQMSIYISTDYMLVISYHSRVSSTFLARQQASITPATWKMATTAREAAMAGTLPSTRS